MVAVAMAVAVPLQVALHVAEHLLHQLRDRAVAAEVVVVAGHRPRDQEVVDAADARLGRPQADRDAGAQDGDQGGWRRENTDLAGDNVRHLASR